MPPSATGSATGLEKDAATFMDDLAKRLDRLEEVLRSLTGKVGDIDQRSSKAAAF
jgi:ABC-type transporter Mla subunit MlaD